MCGMGIADSTLLRIIAVILLHYVVRLLVFLISKSCPTADTPTVTSSKAKTPSSRVSKFKRPPGVAFVAWLLLASAACVACALGGSGGGGGTAVHPPAFAWLHTPKTGTSLKIALSRVHCSTLCPCQAFTNAAGKLDIRGSSLEGKCGRLDAESALTEIRDACDTYFTAAGAVARLAPGTYSTLKYIDVGHAPWKRAAIGNGSSLFAKHGPMGAVMIRDPVDRLMSAFYFQGGHYTAQRKIDPELSVLREWWSNNITRYAMYPGVTGCQTKMLTGWPCG